MLPSSSGEPLNLVFTHSQLKAPLEEYVSPERWPLCQAEWFDYAVHAGINPSLSRDDELTDLHHPSADTSSDTSNTGCYARQRSLGVGSTSGFCWIGSFFGQPSRAMQRQIPPMCVDEDIWKTFGFDGRP